MHRSASLKLVLTYVAFVLLGVALGWLAFAGTAPGLPLLAARSAQAAPDLSQFRDPANPDAPLVVDSCVPSSVGVFNNRIHVECNQAASPTAYRFYALGFGSSPQTARVLSVLEAAHVSGKRLWIGYDPTNLSGALIGCNNSDCRLIDSATIQP
jgi:hypothetical protein